MILHQGSEYCTRLVIGGVGFEDELWLGFDKACERGCGFGLIFKQGIVAKLDAGLYHQGDNSLPGGGETMFFEG